MPNSKILVVDDSRSARLLVSRMLTDVGYEVITANDGNEAIEKLGEEPSLLVLDVNMPGLDGYGVCEKIRELGFEYHDLPVVFLTSLESRALEMLGDEFGAYLNKPVSKEKLLSVVGEQLAQTA